MSDKQLRITNVLLLLILIILIISLFVDLMPYIIAGRMLGSFFRSNNDSQFISISTPSHDPSENPYNLTPTMTPWTIEFPD
jgi:hypothetical protein